MADSAVGTPSTPNTRKSGRRSWFTPGKNASSIKFDIENLSQRTQKKEETSSVETLTLTHFSKPPRLDFGTLRTGGTRVCKLKIDNPHEQDQHVKIEKFPFKKNFIVSVSEFVVPAGDKVIIDITWSPTEEGAARGMALFLIDSAYRVQAIMFGVAEEPPKPKKKRVLGASRPVSILAMKNKKAFSTKKKSPPKKQEKRLSGRKSRSPRNRSKVEDSENIDPNKVMSETPKIKLAMEEKSALTPRRMRRSITYTQMPEGDSTSMSVVDATKPVVLSKDTPIKLKSAASNNVTTVLNSPRQVFGTPKPASAIYNDTPLREVSASSTTVLHSPSIVFGSVGNVSAHTEDTPMRVISAGSVTVTSFVESPPTTFASPRKLNAICKDTPSASRNACMDTPMRTISDPNNVTTVLNTPRHVFGSPLKPNVSDSLGKVFKMPETPSGLYAAMDTPLRETLSPDTFLKNRLVASTCVTPVAGEAAASNFVLDTPSRAILSPDTFLNNSLNCSLGVDKLNVSVDVADTPLRQMSIQGLPSRVLKARVEDTPLRACSATVSPDSFLLDSLKRKHTAGANMSALDTPMRMTMSPGAVQNVKNGSMSVVADIPSPSAVLNNSVSHNAVLQQLDSVKSNVMNSEFNQHGGKRFPAMTPDQVPTPRRETVIVFSPKQVKEAPPVFSLPKWNERSKLFPEIVDTPSPRRETVVVDKPKQVFPSKLFAEEGISPRRETYLVKQNKAAKTASPVRTGLRSTPTTPLAGPILEEGLEEEVNVPLEKPTDFAIVEQESSLQEIAENPLPRRVSSLTVVKLKAPCPVETESVQKTSAKNLFGAGDSDRELEDKDIEPVIKKEVDQEVSATPVCNEGYAHSDELQPQTKYVESGDMEPLVKSSEKGIEALQPQQEQQVITNSADNVVPTCSEAWAIPASVAGRKEDFEVKKSVVTSRLTAKRTHSQTRSQSECRKPDVSASKKIKPATKEDFPKDRTLTRTQKLRIQAAGGSVKSAANTEKQAKKKTMAKGLASSRLLLQRKGTTALPKHPMPFASKNMYYDERWIEKQDRGFTKWLNFVLTPQDFDMCMTANKPTKIDAGTLSIETTKNDNKLAPTKEVLSFRAYSARRSLNRLRRAACMLFQSEPIVRVIQRVEAEVELGRLTVRKDRKIRADLGIKHTVLDMILSYNPLWLRIGLETIYGELLPVQSNTDMIGISRFVLTRLLGNPDIAAAYAHPTVPHSYRTGYDEMVAKFTLKKFLILVFFLDSAKLTRLIDHDPCLFCKDSDYKASRDMLLEFSRSYLSGEGDITKHLSYMGYVVNHKQTARDEFDFAVTKLGVDLRDGMRLTRVVELLTHNWTLSRSLRVPAISRLQKIHNVEVALKALTERGLDLSSAKGGAVTPKDIVEGHREKTHSLLWQLIFNFQVELMLNVDQLKDEIQFLRTSLHVKQQIKTQALGAAPDRRYSSEPDMYMKSEKLSLLLKWCQAVCAYYNLQIENFTVSFSDGRALCYILHYYHPALLPLSAIFKQTTQTIQAVKEEESDGDDSFSGTWTMSYSPKTGKPTEYDRLLANERENFKMLYEKVCELGGVPVMVKSSDMSGTIPDEKVVITYVSYLCARLLDIRVETRAARTIQTAYRRHLLNKRQKSMQVEITAAKIIQKHARAFLEKLGRQRQNRAAILIQSVWRKTAAKRRAAKLRQLQVQERQDSAAVVLQSVMRMITARRSFERKKNAALKIQTWLRCKQASQTYRNLLSASVTIQQNFRAYLAGREQRQMFLQIRDSAITVQKIWRGRKARLSLKRLRATVTIQAWWKGVVQRRQFMKLKMASVIIQSCMRMWHCKERYNKMLSSAKTIQIAYRAHCLKKAAMLNYSEMRQSAIVIQSWYRRHQALCAYVQLRSGVIKAQSLWKCKVASANYRAMREAAIQIQQWYRSAQQCKIQRESYLHTLLEVTLVQAACRGWLVRREMQRCHAAATVLQSCFRRMQARRNFLLLKAACMVIQHQFRACRYATAVRNDYLAKRTACITLQSAFRGWSCRQKLQRENGAATLIQAAYRQHVAVRRFQLVKWAALIVQARYRALLLARKQWLSYNIQRGACIAIQSAWRCHVARRNFVQQRHAAVTLQSHVRMLQARQRYLTQRDAAIVLQRRFRALVVGKNQCLQYQITTGAIVTIQAYFRGHQVRRQIRDLNKAACIIQANVRGHLACNKYYSMKTAACTIQKHFRNTMLGRQQRAEYMRMKSSAVLIQSVVRGHLKKKEYLTMKSSAVKLQSHVRAFISRRRFVKTLLAVRVLQRHVRAHILRNKANADYRQVRHSAIILQSFFRGCLARKMVQRMRAATTIQAHYKGYKTCQYFNRMKQAAVVLQSTFRGHLVRQSLAKRAEAAKIIQTWWRATMLARSVQMEYLISKGAAITIQSYFRGYRVRCNFKKSMEAVVRLQALVRGRITKKNYDTKRTAVLLIQQRWRLTLLQRFVQQNYQAKKDAAVSIQSYFRGYIARRSYTRSYKSLVKLQSLIRGRLACNKYLAMRTAAMTLQTKWRATLLMRQSQLEYLISKGAAITIQAHFRGYQARCSYQKLMNTVITLQSRVRGKLARDVYNIRRRAVLLIQQRWRQTLLQRGVRENFVAKKSAAITIQRYFRGSVARRSYLKAYESIVMLQSRVRGMLAFKGYRSLRSVVCNIQTKWRAVLLGRKVKEHYLESRSAAITLQSYFRGQQARRLFLCLKNSAVVLQSCVRRNLERKRFLEMRNAAIAIQRHWRATLVQRKVQRSYQITLGATITIQAYVRGHQTRARYLRLRAATVIQSYFRMSRQRRQFMHIKQLVTALQARVRCNIQRASFTRTKEAARTLQSHIKAFLIGRAARRSYLIKLGAAITMQAWYRGHVARQFVRQVKAARTLQSAFRGHRERKRYHQTISVIVRLQAHVRRVLVQRQYAEARNMNRAACVIQRTFRTYVQRKLEKERLKVRAAQLSRFAMVTRNHLKVIRIQRCLRNLRAMRMAKERLHSVLTIQRWMRAKLERCRFVRLQHAAIVLQAATRRMLIRKHQAAVVIQTQARVWLAQRYAARWRQAILTIQAQWRGRKQRTAIKSKKLIQIRMRVEAATKAATEDKKLCNRTASALDYLLGYKQLSYILEALINLDVATRLSPQCCERMVEGNAVQVIFTLIRSCNRSLPHMEIIKYSVNILLNLAKYEKTVHAMYEGQETVDTLLDLLQIYREKGMDIFCKTCMLLGLLCNNIDRRDDIRSLPRVADRVKSVHSLTVRKFKMEEKRQAVKSKLNASRIAAPAQTHGKIMRVQPEWIMRRDKVNNFVCPLVAVNFLMTALNVSPK